MRILLTASLSLLTFLVASFAHAGFAVVGNAGEGIRVNGNVYTRDLFDYDLHRSPWVGNEIDPKIAKHLSNWNPLALSIEEKTFLLQKLTDLKKIDRHFAYTLTTAITKFSWAYTDKELTPFPDDEGRTKVKEEDRVAIANRFAQSVEIQKSNFARLDSKNKIALLFHEVVYSLMRVRVDADMEVHFQSLALTRQITAGFFSEKTISEYSFRQMVELEFNFPKPLMKGETVLPEELKLEVEAYTWALLRSPTWTIEPAVDYAKRVQQICTEMKGLVGADNFKVEITLSQNGFRSLDWDRYQNPNGTAQYQLYLRSNLSQKSYENATSEEECEDAINDHIAKYFPRLPN